MLPDLSREIVTEHGGKPKILIIDDNLRFCELLARYVKMLNGVPVIATTYEQMESALQDAELKKKPFSLACIDLRFTITEGSETIQVLQGAEILQYIKIEYPNVACLMISGEVIGPSESLDLRDYYGMDYYLEKDRIEPLKVTRAIRRAIERVKVVQKENVSRIRESSYMVTARQMREIIDDFFNEEELKDLCFSLEIDYETLGGIGKSGKSRELISYSKRHGRFFELIDICRELRYHAFEQINPR